MTWTYTSPTASDKDRVRFLLGDTVNDGTTMTDEEINYLLETFPNVYLAAAEGADHLATKYVDTSVASKKVGELTLSYHAGSSVVSAYRELANRLRQKVGGTFFAPQMADESENIFRVGMADNVSESYTEWNRFPTNG